MQRCPSKSRNTVRLQNMERHVLCTAVLLLLCGAVFGGRANATEIADTPLITSPTVQAKPNLMFVLDDSGSMAWDYMPDVMSSNGKYGFWSSQCNGVAFNPVLTYAPPVKADGTSYDDATFSAAWSDGYAKTGATDLSATQNVTFTSTNTMTAGTGAKTFNFTSGSVDASTFKSGASVSLTSTVTTTTVTYSSSTNRYTTTVQTSTATMVGTVTSWSGSGSSWTLVANVTSNTSTPPTTESTNTSRTGTVSTSTPATAWSFTQAVGSIYYYAYSGSHTAMGWTFGSDGKVNTTTDFYDECMSNIGSSPGSSVFQKQLILNQSAATQQNYANWYAYYRTRSLLMRTAVGRAFKALDGGYRVGFSTINSSTDTATSGGFQPVGDFEGTQKSTLYTKLYGASPGGGTPLRGALSKIGRYYAGKFITSDQPDPLQYSCQRNFVLLSTDGYWNKGGSPGAAEGGSYGPLDMSGSNVGNQDGTEERPMNDGTTSSAVWTRSHYTVTKGTGTGKRGNGCSTSEYRVTNQTQTSSSSNGPWTAGSSSTQCVSGSTTIVDTTASALAGDGTGTKDSAPTSSTVTSGGSSDTLADVAEYYYKTDLRDSSNCTSTSSGTTQNVCSNVVPTSGRDIAKHQHMTTFTIGLGVSGTLTYDRDYLTQTTGSYADLVNGAANWPIPSTEISGSSGDARNIDDLWHAAVNGRGQYYSALNAAQLADAISGVVNTIQEVTGSSSAATTSTLELVSGDNNQVFSASYTTGTWVGDLKAYPLDGDTGAIGSTATWSAQAKLNATAYTARKIYYRKPGTATLMDFNWSNLNGDSYGSYFSGLCSTHSGVSQCNSSLSDAEKTAANDGERLVNYLRGDKTYQAANSTLGTTQALYRARTGLLGDIINGAPRFVSKPSFEYSDAGYSDFVQLHKDRKPVVYVASNDGMLHAISADTADGGTELWAYVPTAVMPELYRLADSNYATRHRYFVDGAPVVGDIYVNGAWKTILVGGLGKGGRSYYALDITDPENPKALWEFTDDNLGLTFGNPVITKRANGTWIVAFGSGYNNVSPGDGAGRLFLVNANTGVKARTDIVTSAGSTDAPSGLAKINGWIDQESDNTSKRFYAGDLQGNLWRFDIDGLVEPKNAALLLAKFQINGTKPQPVTVRPRLAEASGKAVIIVGTGQYLGASDIGDTTKQTIYAVKDSLTNTGLDDVRTNDTLVQQTFTVSGTSATITNNAVNWATNSGWWVDLPHSGERVAIDIALQGSVLAIATAIPTGDACSSGGSSWNYFLGANSGSALQNVAGAEVSANALIVGQSFIRMADGKLRMLRQLSDSTTGIVDSPSGASSNITPQRTSWRELTD